jgi:hypothetical protein
VGAGDELTCAIRTDGTLACWGSIGNHGDASPPAGTFTAVSGGYSDACAIRTDGTLACWGFDGNGQATPPAGTFIAVSAGTELSCAIRTDGTLACWGDHEPGLEFGQATPPSGTFVAVEAGYLHACGIRTDGTLACWGSDQGIGLATPPTGAFTTLSAPGGYTCAIRTDGTLACWGSNGNGRATPPTGTFTAVSAGLYHACAIRTDGTLTCWGQAPDFDDHGQATPPSGTFTAVSAGLFHTCAIRTDGTLTCWGSDRQGQVTPRPLAAIRSLPNWLATTSIPLRWSARPALLPVASYDIGYRRAPWNGGFGSFVTWRSATTATSATFSGSPGSTYCFVVRVRDTAGTVSPWTSSWDRSMCTAIPLDDRSLTRSWSWAAGTGSAYYRSTSLRSSTAGARLKLTGVKATRIALLATTCPTCGSVNVYWGSTLLRSISLDSATTVNRKLIRVASFSSSRTGALTIRIISSGRRVIIDGVAIRRDPPSATSPIAPAGAN